jgi:hypothetical protein
VGEVGGSGGVAGPAADDEASIGAASCCYLSYVVGGEVGRGVGGLACPAWAPVTEQAAVVGDHGGAASAFGGVVVKVGAAYSLGLVLHSLAVVAVALASDDVAAASGEAGADE